MGWNEGEGLGAKKQGIRQPLLAKKTARGRGAGIILAADDDVPKTKKRRTEAKSVVVLLRNMVGPGEVDGELESETANECEKFGRVIKCRIHEEKSPPTPPNKAVRIFVQFADFEAATKALEKMNGRFFAKRVVEATYFDEDRFLAGNLAARPGED